MIAWLYKKNLNAKMQVIGEGQRTGAGSGSLKTQLVLLPKLNLGKYSLTDLPVNTPLAADGDGGEEIGMDVLKGSISSLIIKTA